MHHDKTHLSSRRRGDSRLDGGRTSGGGVRCSIGSSGGCKLQRCESEAKSPCSPVTKGAVIQAHSSKLTHLGGRGWGGVVSLGQRRAAWGNSLRSEGRDGGGGSVSGGHC